MYKVYFGNHSICFPERGAVPPDTTECLWDPDERTLREAVEHSYGKGKGNIAFFSSTGQDLQKIFDRFFRHIPAGGGVVRHLPSHRILMIRRWGKWDLPKGWREAGESARDNALREVREETGLDRLNAQSLIHVSRHAYLLEGRWTIKHTDWFAMTTDREELRPQSEEDIELAQWLDAPALDRALADTYPNIRETLDLYRSLYPLP